MRGRTERMQRAAERQQRREWKAIRKETWRRRRSFVWRNRWNLAPAAVAAVLGLAAWASLIAALVGRGNVAHYAAGLIIATSLLWSFAGELRRGKRRTRRALRDLAYATLVTNYAVGYLYAVRYLYLPFVTSLFDLFAGLVLLGLFGWVPLAVPYWRHYRIRRLRGIQDEYDAWPSRAEVVGWPGAKLRRGGVKFTYDETGTYRGKDYLVRLLPGQSISDFSVVRAKTAFNIPTGGTATVALAGRHDDADDTVTTYRDVVLSIVERNPWKAKTTKVEHPLVANLAQLEKHLKAIAAGEKAPELVAAAKAWLPGARSCHNPIPVAASATGKVYEITIWHPVQGAISWLIGGASGSGKGVFINNVLTGLLACRDTFVVLIDTSTKLGRDGQQWGKALDKLITTKAEAIAYLEGVLASMSNRSVFHADPTNPLAQKIHIPTAAAPLGVIIVDEAASSFADEADPDASDRLSYLVTEIARLGRSDGWCVMVASQRPSNGDLGGSRMKVNMKGRIQLPVETKTDATEVLDHNYKNVEVPVADSVPQGTFVAVDYVHGVSEAQQRTFTVDDYPLLNRIGALYADHRPGFANDPVSTRGKGAVLIGKTSNAANVPGQRKNTNAAAESAAPTGRFTMTDDVFPSSGPRKTTRETLAEVDAQLENLRTELLAANADPQGIDVPVSQLARNHVAPPVPDEPGDEKIRALMLDELSGGPKMRKDLVAAVEQWNRDNPDQLLPCSPTTTFRVLSQLRAAEMIRLDGLGQGALWSLTAPAAEPVDA